MKLDRNKLGLRIVRPNIQKIISTRGPEGKKKKDRCIGQKMNDSQKQRRRE